MSCEHVDNATADNSAELERIQGIVDELKAEMSTGLYDVDGAVWGIGGVFSIQPMKCAYLGKYPDGEIVRSDVEGVFISARVIVHYRNRGVPCGLFMSFTTRNMGIDSSEIATVSDLKTIMIGVIKAYMKQFEPATDTMAEGWCAPKLMWG